jgi:hypothetical protein
VKQTIDKIREMFITKKIQVWDDHWEVSVRPDKVESVSFMRYEYEFYAKGITRRYDRPDLADPILFKKVTPTLVTSFSINMKNGVKHSFVYETEYNGVPMNQQASKIRNAVCDSVSKYKNRSIWVRLASRIAFGVAVVGIAVATGLAIIIKGKK